MKDVYRIGSELPLTPAGEGSVRQILGYNEQLMLVKAGFDKGGVGAVHSHPHSQSTYVVSGRFEVTVGELKRELAAGDGFFVEPGVLHGCVCLEEGVLIDAFSPAREDFLQESAGR